jgi:hypothetical protein
MHKSIVYARKTGQRHSLTSWRETEDSWASREMLASLAFFERLRLRVAGIFLTEAIVILGVISWAEGSSSTTARVEGADVVSFGGSSSSLQAETSYVQHERKKIQVWCKRKTQRTLTMPGGQSIQYLLLE